MGQRYQLIAPLERINTVTPTVYKGVASGVSVQVLRPGGVFSSSLGTLVPSGSGSVSMHHSGHIKNGSVLRVYDPTTNTISTSTLTVTGITTGFGTYPVFNNGPDNVTITAGHRFVFEQGLAASQVTLFEDDTSVNTISQPITVGSDGTVRAWVDVPNVDLYISGGSPAITTDYYPDISTFGKSIIVSPQDFGAIGDGSTDDSNALANCINYARIYGGQVDLWDNTYAVDMNAALSNIAITGKVKIVGRDPEGSVIKAITAGVQTSLLEMASANGCLLRDFKLDSSALAIDGLLINGSSRCTVDNVTFGSGAFESGVKIDTGSNQNKVLGCYFDQMTEYAVELLSADRNVITSGCQFDRAGTNSVIADSSSDNNVVVANVSKQAGGTHWSDAGTDNEFGHNSELV